MGVVQQDFVLHPTQPSTMPAPLDMSSLLVEYSKRM